MQARNLAPQSWEPKLSKVLPLKLEVGQNVAFDVSPNAENDGFLISALPVHSTSFFPKPLLT